MRVLLKSAEVSGKGALPGLDLIQLDDTPGTASRGCDTSRADAGPESAVQCSAEDLIIDGGCDDAGFSDSEQSVRGMPERGKRHRTEGSDSDSGSGSGSQLFRGQERNTVHVP
jgi:hypothetical protein